MDGFHAHINILRLWGKISLVTEFSSVLSMKQSWCARAAFISALLVFFGFGRTASAQVNAPGNASKLIVGVECHGNHRVPCSTIKTRMSSRPGTLLDMSQLNRDFMALWNTHFFDDLRIDQERTKQGIVLQVWVKERPLIRDIKYKGLKTVTESDVLDEFNASQIRLSVDDQYDPTVVKRAQVAIQQLLSLHGRQYATVKTVVTPLPPSAVDLTFKIDEGPKVTVGKIAFRNNHVLSSETLRNSMKDLRPIGIPHSLILESLFSKTYDQAKLSDDLEHIRSAYQDRGYFEALVDDPSIKLRDTHTMRWIFFGGHPAKKVDITIPVTEGSRYRVGTVRFLNNRFITNDALLSQAFGLHSGDIMDVSKLRKGLKNLKELYGHFGYINFVADPQPRANEANHTVDLVLDVQEGKPYVIRRIEFTGNTTTRDKVIRRELLVDEGGRFDSQAWKTSLLRLNQLGYFDEIKPEDATITQDPTGPEGHVDINLHVHEKGKNSIGLTGGVDQLMGSFLSLNYSTNNFLGLGETLSASVQEGALQKAIQVGFTQPYFMDRPIQLGVTVFGSSFHYDQAKEASIFYGQNVSPFFQSLYGTNNLLNYAQSSQGFTVGLSYPLKRSFTRIGLQYGYNISSVTPFTTAAQLLFTDVNFNGTNAPNSLNGIRTSSFTPSFSIDTVNSAYFPTQGRSISASVQFAGIGGNVHIVQPNLTYTYYHPLWHGHVFAMRLLGSMIAGYGANGTAPAFDRYFIGGEDTIRGFDIMAVTPVALIPTETTTYLMNPQNPSQNFTITVPNPTPGNPTGTATESFPVKYPTYQITTPGGDTEAVGNFEYRIPMGKYLTFAYFNDIGMDRVSLFNQLRINNTILNQLSTDFPGHTFNKNIFVVPATNNQIRWSTGLELDVNMPIIHAPVRIYLAYNPMRVDTYVNPNNPGLFTLKDFDQSLGSAVNDPAVRNAEIFTFNQLQAQTPFHFQEAPHVLRFTVGRTF